MTREGAPSKQPAVLQKAGTPIWVWLVYGLGILAGVILAFSLLFTIGAVALSDGVGVSYDVSLPAFLLWGGFVVAALATLLYRRKQRR